jgi:hypothetical protein
VSSGFTNSCDLKAARASALGNFEDAQKLYLEEMNLLLAKGEQADAGDVYLRLGEIGQVHGAFKDAGASYKKGLDVLKRYAKPNDLRLVLALDDLGWL